MSKLKNKIFISHSSKDIDIVKLFVDKVLKLGLGINAERIFCSSMSGHDIRSGEYIPTTLKKELHMSTLSLLFISQEYKKSEICLNEIGASWILLDDGKVVPFLLPDVNFNEIGFLNLSKIGLKVFDKTGIIKFIEDNKDILSPKLNLQLVNKYVDEFITGVGAYFKPQKLGEEDEPEKSEYQICFYEHLYPFNKIIRQSIPDKGEGIHILKKKTDIEYLLNQFSEFKNLNEFWYKFAGGDSYIEKICKSKFGYWLISDFNWELDIKEIWVNLTSSIHNSFILLRTKKLPPYKITSDIAGKDYIVGILDDGRIISDNERLNGYAKFNQKIINVDDLGAQHFSRESHDRWIFLLSPYHKLGFNPDETIKFCKKIDAGDGDLTPEMLKLFLNSLSNHPVVKMYM